MTAAIFGLLGVVVGGLITLGTDVFVRARDERAQRRVAARLVLLEFRGVDAQLRQCLERRTRWPHPESPSALPPLRWQEHAPVLARAIRDREKWKRLEDVFAVLPLLDGMAVEPNARDEETQIQLSVMAQLREDLSLAGPTLEGLA